MLNIRRMNDHEDYELEIYLMRHGQTQFNVEGRIQGWCDSPLTDAGRLEVAKAGKRVADLKIKFDAAFSSTLHRTVETAHLMLYCAGQSDLPVTQLEDLREYHFGGFEGELSDELHQVVAETRGFASKEEWLEAYRHASYNIFVETVARLDPNETAENEADFLARLRCGLFQAIAESPQDRNARVLIVSHGMSITALLKSIDPTCTLYKSVPNACIVRLRYTMSKGLELISIGGQGLLTSKDRPKKQPITNVAKGLGYRR